MTVTRSQFRQAQKARHAQIRAEGIAALSGYYAPTPNRIAADESGHEIWVRA